MSENYPDKDGRSEALVRWIPPQKAPPSRDRWHIISAVANGIMALTNIIIIVVMVKSYQGDNSDSNLLESAASSLNRATKHAADINQHAADVKKQIDDAIALQREGIETQRRAAIALEETAREAKGGNIIRRGAETKPPQVEGVYLGNVQLLKNEEGTFAVHSFTGCPQLKIRTSNPGSLPISAVLYISGSKDGLPFRCKKEPMLKLDGYAGDDVSLNIRECLSEFSECSGGGSIRVRAEKR